MTKLKPCPDCAGTGVLDQGTNEERQCSFCGGIGVVVDDSEEGDVLQTKREPIA